MDTILDDIQYNRIMKYNPCKGNRCWFLNFGLRPKVALRYYKYGKHHCKNPKQCLNNYFAMWLYQNRFIDKYKSILDYNTSFSIFEEVLKNESNHFLLAMIVNSNNVIEKTKDKSVEWIVKYGDIYTRRDDVTTKSKIELYNYVEQMVDDSSMESIFMFYKFSISRNASLEDINDFPSFPWKYDSLVYSPHCRDFINLNLLRDATKFIGCNQYVFKNMQQVIDSNIDLDYKFLRYNTNITYDDIVNHKDKILPCNDASNYIYALIKYVEQYGHPDEKTLDDIITNFKTKYDIYEFNYEIKMKYLHMKYITPENILKDTLNVIYRCNGSYTFRNCLEYQLGDINDIINKGLIVNESFITVFIDDPDYLVLQFMAKRIQRQWRRCISDPEYLICKHRLLKEFYDDIVK